MKTTTKPLAAVAVLMIILPVPRLTAGQSAPDLAAYTARLTTYAALHREVERPLPRLQDFTDPAAGLTAAMTLREALIAARPAAREGDLFGSAAPLFRREVRLALRRAGVEAANLLAEMRADTEEGARPAVVNAPFPWAAGNLMPPCVIAALPPLPPELEYRLIGPDLVLLDIDASLVIDILRDALIASTR